MKHSEIFAAKTKHEFGGNVWLGFERLTHVPIQLKMVKMDMLTKEEKAWLKVSRFTSSTIRPGDECSSCRTTMRHVGLSLRR
jgi:hypothetical protein